MSEDLYQKGIDKIQELTNSPDDDPTGFMDIGEAFKDIAPDLSKYVVEFAFGDIYSRPGLTKQQLPHLLPKVNHRLVCMLRPAFQSV